MADALPLIQTKLFRPPIPRGLVARPRLTNLLDRQPKRPLTLVSAPAGYGKSTLIASWAEASDLPVAWVSLDEHDDDIVIFISYFLAALQSVYPNVGANTSALIQSPEIPTTRLISNTLISEIHHIGEPLVLVLDDYHLVRSASIQDFIEKLLTHPSRHLHLVISTRVDPPLSLSKFRARNQMTEVRLQDLRFTEDEVALLLEKTIGNSVDAKTVTELETQSEGWVTGLRLSALAMRHRLGRDRIHDKISLDNRYVSEYLVSEILSQQSEQLAEQMLKIAILDRFSAELCQVVCDVSSGKGAGDAESFIRWLEDSNLFVISLDDQGIWFRYHHLFQAFLEQELQRRFPADEIAALHQRAGDWFAQNDMLEEAVHHALAAQDLDQAAHFIEDRRHELMNQEQWFRLQNLLKQLPRDFIDENASLLNIEATIFCVAFNFEALVPTLKQVEEILARSDPQLSDGHRAQLEGELAWMWGFVSYWLGDGQKSLEKINEALRVLPPELTFAYARALEYQINACQMTGHFREALELADKALTDERNFGPVFLATIQVSLLVVNMLQGDLPNAERAAQKALRLGRECNLYMTIGWALQTLGYVYYQWNDLEAARGYYEQVLELRYRTSVQAQAHSSFGLARTLQALDETKQARRISRAAIEWAQEVGDARMLVEARAWYAQLMLLNGEAPDTHNWAGALGDSYSQMIFVEIAHLTLAATWIAERTPHSLANADALLGGLRKFCSRVHNNWHLIEVGALEALLFDALGEQQKALHKLGEAIKIARKGGHIRVFVDLGTPMQQLLRNLQQTEVSPGYIDRFLNAFPNTPALSSRNEPNHPLDLLTQRESEILELLAQHLTNKEIAEQLVLSTGTVKQHLYNIYQKLHVKNRGQAIAVAKDFNR